MKKVISIIASLLMLFAIPTNTYAAEKDDPELYKLAYSLGADTDYLAVLNYKHDQEHPFNKESYNDYFKNASILEKADYPETNFSSVISYGSCVGISILEVLSHNGVIKPSDISGNAETLSDINYNEISDRLITDYQAIQSYTEFSNYEKYLISSMTYEEEIDTLIKTAEKCMSEHKYFFISIRTESFSHAVCGIGITDGKWTFNNKDYDKCVLVLDSNVMDNNGSAKGFSNKGCIYINSETKQSYIPIYDESINGNGSLSFAVIDDVTLLNYKGMINGSKKINTDISEIKQLVYKASKFTTTTAFSADNKELPIPEDGFGNSKWIIKFMKANTFHVELENEPNRQDIRSIDPDRWINVVIDKADNKDLRLNCNIDITDNKITINNKNDSKIQASLQIRLNDETYNFAPYYWWAISAFVTDNFSMEVHDNGMLIKNNGNETSILQQYYTLNENGSIENVFMNAYYPDAKWIYMCSNNDVLLSVDENNNIMYFIDDNEDDIYDFKIQKGDVNCDGKIDASDASQVLKIYSRLATTSKLPIDFSIGDFNCDGQINAIDASGILAHYAVSSTEK